MGKIQRNLARNRKKNPKLFFGLILIIAIIIIIILASVLALLSIRPPELTTFEATDYMTGEDITEDMEGTIYIPKESLETTEDHFDPDNFKAHKDFDKKDLDEISLDVTDYNDDADIIWLRVRNGDYETRWIPITTIANADVLVNMYILSADVEFSNVNHEDSEIGIPTSNGTWALENINFADEEDVCQAPIYNRNDDTHQQFTTGLSRYTEVFGFIFEFNDTISTNESQSTYASLTTDEWGTYLHTDNDTIYMLTTRIFTGGESLDYDLVLGAGAVNISVLSIGSGRFTVPSEEAEDLSVSQTYAFSITA